MRSAEIREGDCYPVPQSTELLLLPEGVSQWIFGDKLNNWKELA